jgi:hypothetical protein
MIRKDCKLDKKDNLGKFVVTPKDQVIKNRSKAYDYIF